MKNLSRLLGIAAFSVVSLAMAANVSIAPTWLSGPNPTPPRPGNKDYVLGCSPIFEDQGNNLLITLASGQRMLLVREPEGRVRRMELTSGSIEFLYSDQGIATAMVLPNGEHRVLSRAAQGTSTNTHAYALVRGIISKACGKAIVSTKDLPGGGLDETFFEDENFWESYFIGEVDPSSWWGWGWNAPKPPEPPRCEDVISTCQSDCDTMADTVWAVTCMIAAGEFGYLVGGACLVGAAGAKAWCKYECRWRTGPCRP